MLIWYSRNRNRKSLIINLNRFLIFLFIILLSLIEEIVILFYFILFELRIPSNFKIFFDFFFSFNFFNMFYIIFLRRDRLNFIIILNCRNFLRGCNIFFLLFFFFFFFFKKIIEFILIRRNKWFFYYIILKFLPIFF